ncbi:hypothetical protein SAY86_006448 [Trapa natans]|uniref:F-box domain-containing protein n=1 Tax=Trapa natans TaxID=22666 RepID=A0AAN7L5N2_TRANT|nr:hypothetical protein SAY86_006448 [Trapa natans]
MERLPGDCVSAILSDTSPRDVGRLSAASSTFRSAAESEAVWEKFLPSNHLDIVARSAAPVKFSTKKELFFGLCNPLLIDNGRKSFKLEKPTGRISYILPARELSITWSNDPMYWAWTSIAESRFQEVVELRTIHWLEIEGRIRTGDLSPSTNYAAYLIMKVSARAYGLDTMPSETSVQVGDRVLCSELAYLQGPDARKQGIESLFYCNRVEMLRKKVKAGSTSVPCQREDGWMEIHLGKFFTAGVHGGDDQEVKVSLKEVKGYQLKGGLIVEGIEFRPV